MPRANRVNLSITVQPSTKEALRLLMAERNNSQSRLVENALLRVFHDDPGFVQRCEERGIALMPDPGSSRA